MCHSVLHWWRGVQWEEGCTSWKDAKPPNPYFVVLSHVLMNCKRKGWSHLILSFLGVERTANHSGWGNESRREWSASSGPREAVCRSGQRCFHLQGSFNVLNRSGGPHIGPLGKKGSISASHCLLLLTFKLLMRKYVICKKCHPLFSV